VSIVCAAALGVVMVAAIDTCVSANERRRIAHPTAPPAMPTIEDRVAWLEIKVDKLSQRISANDARIVHLAAIVETHWQENRLRFQGIHQRLANLEDSNSLMEARK